MVPSETVPVEVEVGEVGDGLRRSLLLDLSPSSTSTFFLQELSLGTKIPLTTSYIGSEMETDYGSP